jgi:hypothetical protein
MGKLVFKSIGLVALALLGITLYQATLAGHQSNKPGALSAGSGLIESAMNTIGPASDCAISEFTANIAWYADRGKNFLHINALRARAELATMSTSLPSTFGDWLPKSSSNWLQSTADKASQVAGNNSSAAAKKIPVVNTALNATKERIASVGQSLNGAASGF